MKQGFIVYFFAIGLCTSCSDAHKQTIVDVPKTNNSLPQHKPPGSFTDTIRVATPSAVFYHPDSLQVKKIQAVTDSMVFKSTMHQLFYQMRNSQIVIKKYYPRIKIVEVTKARWLLFEKKDGTKEFIDLNKSYDPEGLFIFDGHKSPRLVDMMNIETELGFYFVSGKVSGKKN